VGRDAAVAAAWQALGGGAEAPARLRWTGPGDVLPARLPVSTMAQATVGVCALAAAELAAERGRPVPEVPVDAGNVATAFVSERQLRVDGAAFSAFAPLSRFWPAADGWVRTHGNYPQHRSRLLRVLGVGSDEAAGAAIARWPAAELEHAVAEAGGLAVAVCTGPDWLTHPQGAAVGTLPLVSLRPAAATGPGWAPPTVAERPEPLLPAAGVRVLDLTRVIAGPVATRTLALLGADVLRVDSPRLVELEGQHLDTGFGKRSTLLDLASTADRRVFEDLLAGADVVVTGYRPGALDRFGLAPDALADRRPGLVVARLGAWGGAGPWAGRRGFDSLVQAATGIAVAEQAADGTPGALPAQALDHGTGYLLASAVLRALTERARRGSGWVAELSLARTAHWLLHGGLGPASGDGTSHRPESWCAEDGRLRYALPAVRLPGGPTTWAHPPGPWGSDAPAWLNRAGTAG
jgi:hypothetical protein